jgi:hypothetical protein
VLAAVDAIEASLNLRVSELIPSSVDCSDVDVVCTQVYLSTYHLEFKNSKGQMFRGER